MGDLKGKKIPLPYSIGGNQNITTQKMKESIFNIILNYFPNPEEIIFYDLFSGSGQIGIEALSRDFGYTVFCELNIIRLTQIKRWLHKYNLEDSFLLLNRHGEKIFKRMMFTPLDSLSKGIQRKTSSFKNVVAFIDPPYSHNCFDHIKKTIRYLHAQKEKSRQAKEHRPFTYKNLLYLLQTSSKINLNQDQVSFIKKYKYGNNQILAGYID